MVDRVADIAKAIDELEVGAAGSSGISFEIRHGPVCMFMNLAGHRLVIYQLRPPEAGEHFGVVATSDPLSGSSYCGDGQPQGEPARRGSSPQLIDARQYVLDSDWGEASQRRRRERLPGAHSWDEYADWHLGLTEGAMTRPRRATRSSTVICAASTDRSDRMPIPGGGVAPQGGRAGRTPAPAASRQGKRAEGLTA